MEPTASGCAYSAGSSSIPVLARPLERALAFRLEALLGVVREERLEDDLVPELAERRSASRITTVGARTECPASGRCAPMKKTRTARR